MKNIHKTSKTTVFAVVASAIVTVSLFGVMALKGEGGVYAATTISSPADRPGITFTKVANEAECVSYSEAASVESVQQACHKCYDSSQSNVARGALWFNSTSANRDSDVVKVEDPNATTVPIYLWGQVFDCNDYATSNSAHHIWFGGKDQDDNIATQALPYLSPNDGTRTKDRGLGTSYSNYIWLTRTESQSGWTLDVQGFKNHSGTQKIGTTAEGYERYEAEVSVNRCYHNHSGGYSSAHNDCYGENSKIVIEILPSTSSGFSSTSSVSGDGKTQTSPEDGATVLEITTSNAETNVTFWHNLIYRPSGAAAGATFPDVSTSWQVREDGGQNRGTIGGGVWSTNGGAQATSPNLQTENITVQVDAGSSKTVCHIINYDPKNVTFSTTNGMNYSNPTYSGNGMSRACVKITRDASTEELSNPGHFWGESRVVVPAEKDVPGYTSKWVSTNTDLSSDAGGKKVTIKLSTDYAQFKFKFEHKMLYDDHFYNYASPPQTPSSDPVNHPLSSSDTFPDIAAHYKIDWSQGESGNVKDDQHHTYGKGDNKNTLVSTTEKTITLNKGETKTYCQTLWHNKNEVGLTRTDKNNPLTGAHIRWDYAEGTAVNKDIQTEVCVEVTRPDDPDDPNTDDDDGPFSVTGSVSGEPVFAGEETKIGWRTNVKSTNMVSSVRRLVEYQADAFLVPTNIIWGADKTRGNLTERENQRKNIDPCAWYNQSNKTTYRWCKVVDGLTQTWNPASPDAHAFNDTRTMVVPDYVGYKYCNTFGYKWQYWYSISYDGNDDWKAAGNIPTISGGGDQYWTNYNAVCRTIAKKPSTAFWNGGVSTQKDITVSGSPRYRDAKLGLDASGNPRVAPGANYRARFGSWSEDLAAIFGETTSFASGAAIARGNDYVNIVPNFSSMTIANNVSPAGHSNIGVNSALRTRLTNYLQNPPNASIVASLPNTLTGSNVYIYVAGGSLTIDHNITLPSNTATIYQIPQLIIFADNVNIKGSVERIDAWIIATGTVDTCSDWKSGDKTTDTETTADSWSGRTGCDKKLTFNGPVIADGIKLHRAYGSDPIVYGDSNGQYLPAEVFNLSAETYLWAYAQAGRYNSSYTEAYSRELAPRY